MNRWLVLRLTPPTKNIRLCRAPDCPNWGSLLTSLVTPLYECLITLIRLSVLGWTLSMPLQHTWRRVFLTWLAMLLSMSSSCVTLLWLNGATNVAISLLTTLRWILLVVRLT